MENINLQHSDILLTQYWFFPDPALFSHMAYASPQDAVRTDGRADRRDEFSSGPDWCIQLVFLYYSAVWSKYARINSVSWDIEELDQNSFN